MTRLIRELQPPPGRYCAPARPWRRAGHRRRHQFHRRGHALWWPLGRHRAPPIPAFRALLLPGEPLGDPRDQGDEESIGVGKPRCHEKAVSR